MPGMSLGGGLEQCYLGLGLGVVLGLGLYLGLGLDSCLWEGLGVGHGFGLRFTFDLFLIIKSRIVVQDFLFPAICLCLFAIKAMKMIQRITNLNTIRSGLNLLFLTRFSHWTRSGSYFSMSGGWRCCTSMNLSLGEIIVRQNSAR
jgi:hypothetical protein